MKTDNRETGRYTAAIALDAAEALESAARVSASSDGQYARDMIEAAVCFRRIASRTVGKVAA